MWKLCILCGVLILVMWSHGVLTERNVPICITNCIQCKQMFGRYFQGRICGDACVSSNGLVIPDCNNPGTLSNYLKRFI